MVVLAEAQGALGGVSDAPVLVSDLPPNRDLQDGPSRRPQHPEQFAHRRSVIGHVLEHVAAIDDVE